MTAPVGRSSRRPWPAVTAVIPARDEAECVGETVGSLLRQDYPGAFTVILVDDQSRDGTAEVARDAAAAHRRRRAADRPCRGGLCRPGGPANFGRSSRASSLPQRAAPPAYLLLDRRRYRLCADALTSLVARAEARGLVLTSLMAKLRCKSFAERMFVPAFIFFFQMLYPFAWANDPRRSTAAAAGGCMLVRRDALRGPAASPRSATP